jgi:hypothetical protein
MEQSQGLATRGAEDRSHVIPVTCRKGAKRGKRGRGSKLEACVTTNFGYTYTTAGTMKHFQNPGRAAAVGIDQGNSMGVGTIQAPRRAARHTSSRSWFAQANSSQKNQSASVIVRANNWNSIRHVCREA